MASMLLGSMLGGGGGGITMATAPPAPPAFRQASAQSPQVPGVQAQQAPIVSTGAAQQMPQGVQSSEEEEKRKQMIELLLKQGLDQNQIQTRLADLDDQKFFQSPSERVEETRQVPPRGLLSAAVEEKEEDKEKPKGILGI